MKRTIALGAAWTASAAAAVGLGFLAVSLVDASASPGPSIAESGTTSSAASSSTSASSTASPSASSAPVAPAGPSAAGQYATPGGTVFADCATGTPVLAGVPAAGWWVDRSDDVGKMEFESGSDEVEVYVACVDGAPRFTLDDSDSRSSASPSASPSATSSPGARPGADDSDGRIGGGRGSDDAPGDDSAGRVSGGSGSDDAPGDDSAGRVSGGGGSDDAPGDDSSGRDGGGRGSDD